MSISKKYNHVVKENGKYYFILPDGSDREIKYVNWVENINWRVIYFDLYRLILNKDPRVIELDKMELEDILNLFNMRG